MCNLLTIECGGGITKEASECEEKSADRGAGRGRNDAKKAFPRCRRTVLMTKPVFA